MLNFLGQVLIYVVPFLLVLTLVVTVHELGHYWVARAFGVKIDRFSIGFGRPLLNRVDRKDVEWRVGWLPLGGYVKFSGDLDASSVPDQAGLEELKGRILSDQGPAALGDYYHFKPVWQRMLIVAGGPFANFVLAIVIFTAIFGLLGDQIAPPRVAEVPAGTPGAAAGLRPNDLIVEVNGRPARNAQDVIRVVSLSSETPVVFTVERDGQPLRLTAVPERTMTEDAISGRVSIGRIGVPLSRVAMRSASSATIRSRPSGPPHDRP